MPDGRQSRTRWAGRFHVPALPAEGESIEFTGSEALHAAGSRRARPGDRLTLFDGSGWEVEAGVVELSRGGIVLEEVSRRFVGPPLAVALTCATALPKGARADDLVAKCAQLGVSRLIPVDFEHSVVQAGANWPKRRARFERLAVEAAKQSGAATLMEIMEPAGFADLPGLLGGGARLVGLPSAESGVMETLSRLWPFDVLAFLVGPEGGLTPEEDEIATTAGFAAVRLAATTLRVETACAAFAVVAAAFISEHTAR